MFKNLAKSISKASVYRGVFCISVALICAKSTVLGFSSPISVAICAVLPSAYCFVFSLITLLSQAVFGISAHSLASASATLFIVAIKIIKSKQSDKQTTFTPVLVPLISYLAFGILFLLLFSAPLGHYIALILLSLTIPTLICAYNNQSSKQMLSLLFITAVTTLSAIDFVYFNLGRSFGIYVILSVCFYKGAALSCFAGLLSAIAVSLYDPALFSSTVSLCIIGIVCSNVNKDKLRIPLYAFATSVVCAALSGADVGDICLVTDTTVAAIAFVFTEGKASALFESFFSKSVQRDFHLSYITSNTRLTSSSLNMLKEFVSSLSNAYFSYKPFDISSSLYSSQCLPCPHHDYCFSNERLDFPQAIKSCQRSEEMLLHSKKLKQYNQNARLTSSNHQAKFQEALVLLDAFHNYSCNNSVLNDSVRYIDTLLSEKLSIVLSKSKAAATNCAVFSNGKAFVEFPKRKHVSESRLCDLLSEFMSINYQMPNVAVFDDTARYTFLPPLKYSADFGTVQLSEDESYCGDTYDCFNADGRLYYILCDGMGTGKLASISSSLLIELLKRQLKNGTSAVAAISLSSLIMRLIKPEESFSTLDMLSIDLNTGECIFYKSGSCPSYVIGEGISIVSSGGYPIGILANSNTVSFAQGINEECVIVIFSDGAKDIPYQLVEKTVKENMSNSAYEIADSILKNSQASLNRAQNDDITIGVIKLKKIGR